MSTVIGLSFGNTTTSIAYTKEGVIEVIANADGDRDIPSMLAYAHEDEFHGIQAKQQMIRNAANTIGYFRDLVSAKFSEIDHTKTRRLSKPVETSDGAVGYEINGEIKHIDQIIERQFTRIHEAARDYIGKEIDGVVLALPSDFPEHKRAKLLSIAEKSGLKIVQVIGELESALLAHISRENSRENKEQADKLFVVADFGGTRSDAAVISCNSGIFTVLSTLSDHSLGGRLLDESILTHLVKEFKELHKVDPSSDHRAIAKLLLEAETIRKTLSNSTSSQYGIDSVTQGLDFSGGINRLKYEITSRQVFTKFNAFIVSLLKKAEIDPFFIDEVLLVGGVSWTPKIASTVGAVFDERTVIVSPSTDSKAIPPNELVARGCAIQGSIISNLDLEEVDQVDRLTSAEQLSKTIGVVVGDKSIPVLGKYTLIPTKKTVEIEATADSLKIAEFEPKMEITIHKPEPKTEEEKKQAAEEDSDYDSEDDDEWEEKSLRFEAEKTLAEVALPIKNTVKVTLYITSNKTLQVSVTSNGQTVQGSV